MALFNITIEKLVLEIKTHDPELLQSILKAIHINNQKITKMALSTEAAVAKIDAQTQILVKVKTEVENLKDAVSNSGNVPPEVEAALGRLDAAISAVDELNEDEITGDDGTGEEGTTDETRPAF